LSALIKGPLGLVRSELSPVKTVAPSASAAMDRHSRSVVPLLAALITSSGTFGLPITPAISR
jgi:hypothetical protein